MNKKNIASDNESRHSLAHASFIIPRPQNSGINLNMGNDISIFYQQISIFHGEQTNRNAGKTAFFTQYVWIQSFQRMTAVPLSGYPVLQCCRLSPTQKHLLTEILLLPREVNWQTLANSGESTINQTFCVSSMFYDRDGVNRHFSGKINSRTFSN